MDTAAVTVTGKPLQDVRMLTAGPSKDAANKKGER